MTPPRHRRSAGQSHPKAKLTDGEVDRIRNLAEAGWSYNQLASAFEVSKGCICKIVLCQRRAVVPSL
jgi:hypothetical protein